MSIYRRVLLVTALAATLTSRGLADSPSVTAVLRNSEAVVGQMVAMEIKVTGGTHVRAPNEISVDGLEIHRTGEAHESQLTFGFGGEENSSSTVYSYTILPTRAGTFTIPPQTVRVGNQSLQTPELTLHVTDAPGRSSASQSNRSAGSIDTSKLVFAELIVPKKSAFV